MTIAMPLRIESRSRVALLVVGLLGGVLGQPAMAQVDPPPLFEEVLVFQASVTGEETPAQALPAVRFNAAAWGDYDGDGDFDLFLTGNRSTFNQPVPFTQFYINVANTFTQIFDPDAFMGFRNVPVTVYADALNVETPVLDDVWLGAVAWADYDNDGDLDVLATGETASGAFTTNLYENVPDVSFPPERFTRPFSWPGVRDGAVAWADYDNDGDLDFVLAGTEESGQAVTALYENQVRTGGGFMRRDEANLVGLHSPSLAWGDYDNDGDHDLLVTGLAEPQAFVTRLYRNDGNGLFTDINAGLKGLLFALAAWGDFDADGDLDILLSGARLHPFILEGQLKVYENTGAGFSDQTVTLEGSFEGAPATGRFQGSAGWGDFNNDGFLDFFVAGLEGPQGDPLVEIYRYAQGNRFTRTAPGNPPAYLAGRIGGGLFGSSFWGDYDGDNDLDIFILAERNDVAELVTLRSYLPFFPPNTPPTSPTGLTAMPQGNSVMLRWQAAQDAQTPAAGLSYNLRVGTTPGGVEVLSPLALPATGHRLVAAQGNVSQNLEWTLKNLPSGTYFWSVQAIDNSYKGSAFAPEGTFTIP